MDVGSGVALKAVQWFIRAVQFCCCAIVLGIYSFFLATLRSHNLRIATYARAVEGISGGGVLYTLLGLLLLCCLAGHILASSIAMMLDIAFIGAFIYVAWANRSGAGTCRGYVDTPYGNAQSGNHISGNGSSGLPSFRSACRMETACLAVSIVAIVFFLLSILMELILVRHHRKEKRFGPSPANNYTSGYGRRGLFGLRRGRKDTRDMDGGDPDALPQHTYPSDVRDSYPTGTTAVGQEQPGNTYNKHGEPGYAHQQPGHTNGTTAAPGTGRRYGDGVFNA